MRDSILGLVTPMTALLIAATFFALWLWDKERRVVLAISVAYLLNGIGFLMSQFIPIDLGRPGVGLTNIPYYIGSFLFIWAVATRVNRPAPVKTMAAAGIIAGPMICSSMLFAEFTSADLYISSTLYAVMYMLGAQATASTRHHNIANAMVFWMLVLTSLQFFIRPSLSFMIEGALMHETYRESMYYSVLNASVAINSLGLAIALIAACASDYIQNEKEAMQLDSLTGLLTRRAFEEEVEAAMVRAEEARIPLAMVVGDIDHFKKVNDIWGHQAGDTAIGEFGKLIGRTIRDGDFAGRIGGEEFCIVVWNCEEAGAAGLAERLRARTTKLEIDEGPLDLRITASFGVSERVDGESYRALFARADAALYASKDAGRDRVTNASQMPKRNAAPQEFNEPSPINAASVHTGEGDKFKLNYDLTHDREKYAS
ncbi:MAG: GGDEF domain-containing protein [Pseudomonadota bacterium]